MPQYVVRMARTDHIDLLIEADNPERAAEAAYSEGDEIASIPWTERIIEVKPFVRDEYTTVVV